MTEDKWKNSIEYSIIRQYSELLIKSMVSLNYPLEKQANIIRKKQMSVNAIKSAWLEKQDVADQEVA